MKGGAMFIVRFTYRLTKNGKRVIAYAKDECARNILADATRFETREQAEDYADIWRINIQSFARGITIFIGKVDK